MRSDLDEHPSVSTVVALSVYNNILGTQTAAQGRAYIRIHVYTCIHIQNYNIYNYYNRSMWQEANYVELHLDLYT